MINGDTGVEDHPRLDFISTRPLAGDVERRIAADLETLAAQFDAILVADQAETDQGGVVTPAVRETIAGLAARTPGKVFWVDSRMRPELFRRAIVKPNQQEADAACLRRFGRVDYQALRREIEAPLLVVTYGGDGALLLTEDGEQWIKTRRVAKPVDICGAGDSFSAGAAMALAAAGIPGPSGAVRQPGSFDHDHEEGHGHGIAR